MSDWTTVTLEVRKADVDGCERLRQLIDVDPMLAMSDTSVEINSYEFEEVEGGELTDIERVMEEHRIPFDTSWGSGGEYSAGRKSVRFSDDGVMTTSARDVDMAAASFEKLLNAVRANGVEHAVSFMSDWFAQNPDPIALCDIPTGEHKAEA